MAAPPRPRRAAQLLALWLLIFALLWAPGQALAEDPGGRAPTTEERIDAAVGVAVGAMASVLFYPVMQNTGVAQADEAGAPVTEEVVEGLIARLEAEGIDPTAASYVVVLPRGAISAQALPAFKRALERRHAPALPRGIQRIDVRIAEDDSVERVIVEGTSGGIPIIVIWLAFGAIFFTFRYGFINIRAFRHAIDVVAGRYDDPNSKAQGEVTHFQALTSALSATVGLGNIAGVAIAVAVGGPGAVFWMMVAGLFGMSAKFNEITLAMQYRSVDAEGQISGGPMWYLWKGLEERGMGTLGKGLGVLFALLCVGGSLGGGNTFQVSQAWALVREQFPQTEGYGWVFGLTMVALTAVVIVGGIKRIAATAERIVPLMAVMYIGMCVIVMAVNWMNVPVAAARIVSEAFTPQAGYGGLLGVLVTGLRRAVFSNEAGVGSAAIAHSAVKTDYPVREGLVALLEPFVDTVVICAITGITIVVTGAFEDPANADLVAAGSGSGLTARAVGSVSSAFPYILTFAALLFAYSTMISWSYYGERCFTYLFGVGSGIFYKLLFLLFVLLGAIVSAGNILNFGDLMILSMAVPNILGGLILHGAVKRDLDTYMADLRSGKLKRFR